MSVLLSCGADERAQWYDLLAAALPGEQLVTHVDDARDPIDIALVANPPQGVLAALPALRLIQSLWAGVDGLLRDATLPEHVPIARMVDPAMSAAMAETALWAVLTLQRDFHVYTQQQNARRWLQHPQRRADELTVAVLGVGAMGAAVARRLAAHGCRVRAWGARPRALEGIETHAGKAALPAVLAGADIVVNVLPLTADTRGLLGARTFAMLAAGASLVNLARGAHVVEADLLQALDSGRLRHAVLDVFDVEPLPVDHPYWQHRAVTVLPHIAAQTDPRSAAAVAAANVQRVRAGLPPQHTVDRTRGY